MSTYNVVMETSNSTVVTEYEPVKRKSDSYQSEQALENEFIRMLTEQGYDYLEIHDSESLIKNLRTQLEIVNDYKFTDSEWDRFFNDSIANNNDGIVEKTRKIQEDNIQVLKKDDGTSKNITLIDKKCIHNNRLQVINQYVENSGNYDNRYDVTILVNGLPLVHIELKRRGVALKEAFNQINRYQRDSFWAGSGLYEYIQIFVISNGTSTKYYSNTTRESHIKEQTSTRNKSKKTSNSFEFTSYWADSNNKVISDLVDFTRTFFAKHTILNILTKYCVFTSEELLLVMRPYQIVATERILNRIQVATNYKKMGTIEAGGYIWHTTGSGKTLTSFKTAQLTTNLEYIDKDESVSKAARFLHTELDKLYDELCFKAENSIYKKRPASQAATLKNGQKTFLAITNLKEKAQVINNIITMFRCDATTTTNLKTIGGSANAGGMQVNKNTLTSQKVVLVHQSITGLFGTEEELL